MSIKMTNRLKNKWSRRLRAGKLKQTTEYLRRVEDCSGATPGYCCLGVLALECGVRRDSFAIINCNTLSEIHKVASGQAPFIDNGTGREEILNSNKLRSIKIASDRLPWFPKWLEEKLTSMNDGEGCTFNEIADYIDSVSVDQFNQKD